MLRRTSRDLRALPDSEHDALVRRFPDERHDPPTPRISVPDATGWRPDVRSRAGRPLAAHAAPVRARSHQPLAPLRWKRLDADRLRLRRRAYACTLERTLFDDPRCSADKPRDRNALPS